MNPLRARSRHHPRLLTFAGLVALAAAFSATAFAGSPSSGGTDAARYAGMPDPEALDQPSDYTTARQSAAFALGRSSVRLLGTQLIYDIDEATGQIVGARREELGAVVYQAATDSQTFADKQFVQLLSGPFAGSWVDTSDTTRGLASRSLSNSQLEVAAGRHTGVRFYSGGNIRVRQPVFMAGPATYSVSRRATFRGRTFYLVSDGPLADRWISERNGVTLVSNESQASANVDLLRRPNATPSPTAPPTEPAPVSDEVIAPPAVSPSPAPSDPPALSPLAGSWKGIVLIYRDTDVTFTRSDGSDYHLQVHMSDAMHDLVLDTVARFQHSVSNWSSGMVEMPIDVVEVPHPLTSLDQFGSGYWVGPNSVEADINQYAPTGSYDSVFVIWQARDDAGQEVPVGGWGLTLPPGTWANGAGYSSIIAPAALWWWSESPAPEEVFMHEWLHQVIFWNEGKARPSVDLHAPDRFGYGPTGGTYRGWLSDVMTGHVPDGDHMNGITAAMWAADKPSAP